MLLTLRCAPSFRIPLCRHVGVWIFFSFGLGDACPLVAYAGCVVCFALRKRFRTPFCGRGFRFFFRDCLFLVHYSPLMSWVLSNSSLPKSLMRFARHARRRRSFWCKNCYSFVCLMYWNFDLISAFDFFVFDVFEHCLARVFSLMSGWFFSWFYVLMRWCVWSCGSACPLFFLPRFFSAMFRPLPLWRCCE